MGTALARCLAALDAGNREREVTAALATMLDEQPSLAAPEASIATQPEAIPQAIGESEESSGGAEIALSEMEIIEASGPIRNLAAAVETILAGDTRKISITLPPEAFPPRRPETIRGFAADSAPSAQIFDGGASGSGAQSSLGKRPARVRTQETTPSERAVALFDQGLTLRLDGRYEEALEAWDLALRLAPENNLYQVQVNKLRAQLQSRRRPG